MTSHFVNVCK